LHLANLILLKIVILVPLVYYFDSLGRAHKGRLAMEGGRVNGDKRSGMGGTKTQFQTMAMSHPSCVTLEKFIWFLAPHL
jgi:hypothetical protein